MTVTATELRSWTTPGAQEGAQATYASISAALNGSPRLAGREYEIFLQGSYANSTNTRGDSDVDIVVMLTSTYMPETTLLPPQDRAVYEQRRAPGTFGPEQFREAVRLALVDRYGADLVKPKNKCLRVPRHAGLLDADVVPALQHRRFTSYPSYGEPQFVEGISIRPLRGSDIVNYPKEHRKNGTRKNADTGERYKPTVRQIKRLRRRAVDEGLVTADQAPGYLLECMTFNAPTGAFQSDEAARVGAVLRWLDQHTAEELAARIWSCDKIHHLFLDDPGGHNQYTAKRTITALLGML